MSVDTTTTGCEIRLEPRWNGAVASLAGDLTVRCAADVRRRLDAVVDIVPDELTIDLSDVARLDTAGLAAVTAPAMRARRAAIAVTILPPTAPPAQQLVDRVGVLSMFDRTSFYRTIGVRS